MEQRLINAAMQGRITEADLDRALDIVLRVQRVITCPITGRVLDGRTAHLLSVTVDDGHPVLYVVDPSAMATLKGDLDSRFPDMWEDLGTMPPAALEVL